jgi:hypothetical protein
MEFPPEDAVYQKMVYPVAVAFRLEVPPEQMTGSVAVTLVGAAGPPVTVTVTGVLEALGQVLNASA